MLLKFGGWQWAMKWMERWMDGRSAVGVGGWVFYKECQLLWKPQDNPFHCGSSLCIRPLFSYFFFFFFTAARHSPTYKVRVTLYLSNNGHRLCLAQQWRNFNTLRIDFRGWIYCAIPAHKVIIGDSVINLFPPSLPAGHFPCTLIHVVPSLLAFACINSSFFDVINIKLISRDKDETIPELSICSFWE